MDTESNETIGTVQEVNNFLPISRTSTKILPNGDLIKDIMPYEDIHRDPTEYLRSIPMNYHFDDAVGSAARQPLIHLDFSDDMKLRINGVYHHINDIDKMEVPQSITLKEFVGKVYDQGTDDIATACAIASAIRVRTNYINYQRYRITKLFLGNKFTPVNPSVTYIHWNAKVKNGSPAVSPSIASHLQSIESHRIVDVEKYPDDVALLNREPNLRAFYFASKAAEFEWFKFAPEEIKY